MNNNYKKNYQNKTTIIFSLIAMIILIMPIQVLAGYETTTKGPGLNVYFMSQDPDPAERGDYVTLRWKIDNLGDATAQDVDIQLVPRYPFSLNPDEDGLKRVGDIWHFSDNNEERSLIIKYDVRVDELAEEGMNDLTLRWRVSGSPWTERDFEVEVEDKPDVNLQLGNVNSNPLDLVADSDENSLEIEVQNVGEDNAEQVVAELELPEEFQPSYSNSNRENLGNIIGSSSSTAIFHFDLDEEIESGWYDGLLKLQYKEESENNNMPYLSKEVPVKIYVKPTPLFEITNVKTIPENIKPGDEVTMIISVKNIGSEEGESVSLRAFKDSSHPFDFDEKSDFIGSLKPGEEGEAALELTIDKQAASKEYRVELETRTVDGNNILVDNHTVSFDIVDEKSVNKLVWLLAAIIIIGGIIFWFIRKPKKNKKKK